MYNLLNIENLSKKLDNFKLKNINIELKKGEIVALVGENGAGKSTLLNTITTKYIPDSGCIYFLGSKVEKDSMNFKNNMSVVSDKFTFMENLNLKQLNMVLTNVYKNWDEISFDHYIDEFDLPMNMEIGKFSKGMSMKASLAVALSHSSKILFLDEATTGLDISSKEKLLLILKEYVGNNKGIVMTSHLVEDIEYLATKIIFMKKGEVIFQVSKKDIFENLLILNMSFEKFNTLSNQPILAYRRIENKVEVLVNSFHIKPTHGVNKITTIDQVTKILMDGKILKSIV